MEPTSVSQCLETPWISKVGIDRLDEKWQCEGKERPFAPKPRFYTETKRINIVTEFYKRFPKTKDSQMNKITPKQFDAFPSTDGIKQCPAGDYTLISSFGEGCSFGKGCEALSPFWSYVYEPPFATKGKIYPPESCKNYWSERLGLQIDGCCSKIEEEVAPLLVELLKQDKWTKCERRILESWRKPC